jgi:maltooligosyltrehalose trehalohydrolase
VRVALTGENEGYYAEYAGTAAEIAQSINTGFLHQQGPAVSDEPARAFVFCIQNHDQIGNRAFGERLHQQIDRDRYAAACALLLCAPQTPLLFMGQEFAASTPFLFFTDFEPDLGRLVTEGRRGEFAGFRAFADPAIRDAIPDPQKPDTFCASRLDLCELQANAPLYRLYQALLALRRDDPVLRHADRDATRATAAGPQIVLVRRWHEDEHRLLVANFGAAARLPLSETTGLRDLPDAEWRLLLSTADERFGGTGHQAAVDDAEPGHLSIPARSAAIFALTLHPQ